MITELASDPKEALKGKDFSVVVFYAPLCGDCNLSEEFELKLSKEFEGRLSFFRLDAVNYDDIADGYSVEHYPTYIFFRKRKPLRGYLVEPMSESEVRNWLEQKIFDGKRD